MREYLNVKESADYFALKTGLKSRTFHGIHRKKLPFVQMGHKTLRIKKDILDDYIKKWLNGDI